MKDRGSILIVTLFVLVVLGMVALSLSYRAGLQYGSVRRDLISQQLNSQIRSVVAIAVARLRENTNDFDHPGESWCTHVLPGEEGWLSDWVASDDAQAQFAAHYKVIDEQGKRHVLTTTSEILEVYGMEPEQNASLGDWMDSDSSASVDGAESDYYMALSRPFRSKDSVIETIEELMLLRGSSRLSFLGEDTNFDGVLDEDEDLNSNAEIDLGWVDLLTTLGDGKININTAPYQVLTSMPGLSEEGASQVDGFRQYHEGSSDELTDHVFQSEADIQSLHGLSDEDKAALSASAIFKSEYFRILAYVEHASTGMKHAVQVLVHMEDEKPVVLQWMVIQ